MAKHYTEFTKEELQEILDMNVEDFGLNSRIAGLLDDLGVYDVRGLLHVNPDRLLQLRGCNKRTLEKLREFLRTKGFY